MKKFVYLIFALSLTIGCLDKTTDSQINGYLDHPLHGENLKIHFYNEGIDSSFIDSVNNTPIFPNFDKYIFDRPDFAIFITNKGDVVDYQYCQPKNHRYKSLGIDCISFYRDYDFSLEVWENNKNAIGFIGDEDNKTYNEWAKKVTWYKIYRFKYIRIKEIFDDKNNFIAPRTFFSLKEYSITYNNLNYLGCTNVKILNAGENVIGEIFCEYLMKAPSIGEAYMKFCHNWLMGSSFHIEPTHDITF